MKTTKFNDRQSDHQQTPGGKLVEEMRNVKKEWLSPMHLSAESSQEFALHDLFIEFRNKFDSCDHPATEDQE